MPIPITGTLTPLGSFPVVSVSDVQGAASETYASQAAIAAVAAIPVATSGSSGLATAAQVTKLDSIPADAQSAAQVASAVTSGIQSAKFGPFPSIAAFRAATPPSVLTSYVIDGVGTCVYRPTDGAGVADNGVTIFKPTSVDVANPGRGYLSSLASTAVDGTPAAVTRIVPPPNAVVTGGNLVLNGDELNRLISGLVGVLGSKMPDAFFGEALVNLGTLDTTWPSSIGRIYPLTHTGSGPFYKIHFDPITRRKCIADTVGSQSCSLRSLIPLAIKAFLIVFRSYGLPPGPSVIATAVDGSRQLLSQQSGTMLLREEAVYGSPVHYIDGVRNQEMVDYHVLYAEDSGITASGFCIAGNLTSYSMFGELYAAIPLTATLTATELADATALLHRFYGIRKNDLILIDGTSIPNGSIEDTGGGSAGQFKWHPLIKQRLCGVINASHPGWTLTQIETQLPTLLAAYPVARYRRVIYYLDGDTNSLRSGVGWTGQQAADANWRISAAARAAGCKVVLSSCLPYDWVTDPPVNAIKNAQWPDHADAYCDLFNAGIELNNNLHPTKDGYMKYAAAVRASVWPLLA